MGFYKIDVVLKAKHSKAQEFINSNGSDYVLEKIIQPNLIRIRSAKTENKLAVLLEKDKDYIVKFQ